VGAEENVRALLALDYPGELELLFVLDGEDDPAWAPVRAWTRAMPTRARRVEVLVAGPPPHGRTGKLNAMLLGVARACGTLLAFSDSDTRPAPDTLTRLVAALADSPRAGSTFAPIYAQADAPLAGDAAYGLVVNAWYGSSVLLARGERGQMPFIMGQLMVLRREALAAVGGIECLEGQLVDDMYLGQRLVAAGWEARVVVDAPLRVVTGGLSMGDFFALFRRWLLFSKSGLPLRFTWPNWARALAVWAAWASVVMGLAGGAAAGVLAGALALGLSTLSQERLQRACHGPALRPRHRWLPALLPVLASLVAARALRSRRVEWRGRSYTLDRGARLERAGSSHPAGL
jgi:ceramide glucosyltransferase